MGKKRGKSQLIACQYCDRYFGAAPSEIALGKKFCSWDCYNKSRSPKQLVVCQQCGKNYEVSACHVESTRYCSLNCYNKVRAKPKKYIVCQQCGKRFAAKPSVIAKGRKFCSRKCASLAATNQVNCTCEHCGKKFSLNASHAARGRRYCSRKCYFAAHKIVVSCKQCGNEIYTKLGKVNSGRANYCSAKCGNEAKRKERVPVMCPECGKKHTIRLKELAKGRRYCSIECFYSSGWTTLTCTQCGKEFKRYKSLTSEQDHVFCSPKCFYQFRTGERNNLWRGGVSQLLYGSDWIPRLKRQIRRRDKYACAICKAKAKSVHHIDYDKRNHDPMNLITLCRSCHTKTGHHRRFYQTILFPVAMERQCGMKGKRHD